MTSENNIIASMSPKLFDNGKPTFGFLITEICSPVHQLIWTGITDAAREQDVNLICFFGVLDAFDKKWSQPKRIYDLANAGTIDGLIIWNSALAGMSAPDRNAFLHNYSHLPLIIGEQEIERIPHVLQDNREGMHHLLTHLIEEHGYRRIAFLRGPETSLSARERYQGYRDMLARYNLPYEDRLISRRISNWEEAEGSYQTFLQDNTVQPGKDFDVVVGAGPMASIIDLLHRRGFQVPDDVAVAVSGETPLTGIVAPPLTTTVPPHYDMGRRAVELLLVRLRGKSIPERTVLPSTLVVRQSCGCFSSAIQEAALQSEPPRESFSVRSITREQEQIVNRMLRVIKPYEQGAQWMQILLETCLSDVSGTTFGEFLPALRNILRQVAEAHEDIAVWQNVVSVLRRECAVVLSRDSGALLQADDLWQQTRILIGETAERFRAYRAWRVEEQQKVLRAIEAALMTSFDVDAVMQVLEDGLPHLHIPGSAVALYETPNYATARLRLAYTRQGCTALSGDDIRFSAAQLMPNGIFSSTERVSLVVEPLYYHEHHFGFAAFEIGPRDGTMYDVLCCQISTALQGAFLVAQITRQKFILDTFIETVPDRIYFKDRDGRITRTNRAHASRMGFRDATDVIGKTDFDFFQETEAQIRFEQEQGIMRSGEPVPAQEEHRTWPDGRTTWSLVTKMPLRDEHGDIIGTFGISRDITDLKRVQHELMQYRDHLEELVDERTTELTKINVQLHEEVLQRTQAEQSLRISESQYRNLTGKIQDGLVIVQDQKMVFTNPAFATMTGYPFEQLVLLDPAQIFRTDPQNSQRKSSEKFLTTQDARWQAQLSGTSGRTLWTEIEQTAFVWNNRPALLLLIRDISEQKAREQILEEERARLEEEYLTLRSTIKERYRFGELIGKSPAMQRVYELIVNTANAGMNVLIYGESGTGKELIARTLHQVNRRRKEQPFVPVNCASIPENLFEREFFGHRKGAFTGADKDSSGLFDRAHRGTLFLDEVTELNPGMQAKLLRALQDGEYVPLGSTAPKQANVVIVAATNKNWQEEIAEKRLREDFFYRIGVIEIHVPPLRERKEDLPLLIEHILAEYRRKYVEEQGNIPEDLPTDQSMLPGELIQALYSYHWPGNIRELQNVIQRYVVTHDLAAVLSLIAAFENRQVSPMQSNFPTGLHLPEYLKAVEKQVIANTLLHNHHHITKTAKQLGIPLRTLHRKIKTYQLMEKD